MRADLPAFDLRVPGQIRFGRGAAPAGLAEIGRFGSRAFVVHGRSAARVRWLMDGLQAAGLACTGHPTAGEPELAQLTEAVDAARAWQPDMVIGCGGGSALDLAKAVAALIPNAGAPLDYLEVIGEGRRLDADPLPFIAIPTTAGTGSEATKNAVIGSHAHARKVSLRDDRMLARLALVDPALTDETPRSVTLSCGLDALTQVIEPYLSCRANPLTDALCRAAIPMGLGALSTLATGEDAAARDRMAFVSLTGGIALANAGLGVVHGLAGPLGGVTGAAHGAICGALLPFAMDANRQAMRRAGHATDRIDEISAAAQRETGRSLADLVRACHDLGVPRLAEMGLEAGQLEEIAAAALQSSSMRANPVPLGQDEVARILAAALA